MKLETIRKIVEKVTEQDLLVERRFRDLVNARAIYYMLAKKYTTKSLYQIGNSLKKNHATVIHSLKNIDGWLQTDKQLQNLVNKTNDALETALKKNDSEFMTYENLVISYNNKRKENKRLIRLNEKLINENNELKDSIKRQNKYLSETGYKLNMVRAFNK